MVIACEINVNQYCVSGTSLNKTALKNYYSPVKYKFTGKKLEIHVYVKFVQYNENGTRTNADRVENTDGDGNTSNYKRLCLKSFFKHFDGRTIKGSKNDFNKNFLVKTKLYVHDGNTRQCYKSASKHESEQTNENQVFVDVCLGGVCPVDSTQHWYHINQKNVVIINGSEKYNYYAPAHICMPLNDQVKTNKGKRSNPKSNEEIINETAGHELGHILGLRDAYTKNGIDRMANNGETCLIDNTKKISTSARYQNIMYHNQDSTHDPSVPTANDFEMMLTAYANTTGAPWFSSYLQAYKTFTYNDKKYTISAAIKNKKDELEE